MVRRRATYGEPAIPPHLIATLRGLSRPLGTEGDLDPLVDRIGDSRYVLLGEASHGTHEFYTWRAAISRRLIQEKGFTLIAVEGDWPDCYRVNRYVKGSNEDGDNAHDVLQAYQRWPTWMWGNLEIADLARWLRTFNHDRPQDWRVGFYGLDVYSLWDSLYHVLGYVAKRDPQLLSTARQAFQCFEPYAEDAQQYAAATRWLDTSCEDEVVQLLTQLRSEMPSSPHDDEAQFNTEQNALVLRNAERYYRTMVRGGADSWNIRDRHMVETLDRLMQHYGAAAKVIVWEHNTHIGDARYTDMADDGMVNVGQLVREAHTDDEVTLVGFASHRGSVIAGEHWDAPMQRMNVPAARRGSWEDVIHQVNPSDQLFLLDEMRSREEFLEERGHRAIGVVYHPEREHLGNYVPTVMPHRYDALVYLDQTTALQPLTTTWQPQDGDLPETFPSGM